MSRAYLVDGIRTPIGRYAGALSPVRPDDLAAHVLRELCARHPGLDWAQVDDVVLGCANQAGEDNRNVARMALLLAGLPESVSGSTVNRLCGSGADAVAAAARSIRAAESACASRTGPEYPDIVEAQRTLRSDFPPSGSWLMSCSLPYGCNVQVPRPRPGGIERSQIRWTCASESSRPPKSWKWS